MKKTTIIIVLALVLGGAVYYFWLRSGKKTQAISLSTDKPRYGYIAQSITATGTVQPVDTVSVGAQVSGVVSSVYVDFNDVIKEGQLLAKIDPAIINAQLEQAQATLANAKSNLEYQQNNYDRQTKLFNLGAISQADGQLATNQYNVAKASVANAEAQLKLSERNLYYTNIYSPINGVVLNRSISKGQTIASSFNAPTLFVIAKDLTKMQVRAAVDEADIGEVRIGQRVSFTVDAFPNDVFEGTVKEILLHPSVSSNVVTYTTLIDVDNTDLKLKPGMTASITIYVKEESNVLLIPVTALAFKPDSALTKQYALRSDKKSIADTSKAGNETDGMLTASVWVKNGDTLSERKIITGLNDDAYVKVIEGLSPNDEIIIGTLTGNKASGNSNAQKSPFMPQMPTRSKKTTQK